MTHQMSAGGDGYEADTVIPPEHFILYFKDLYTVVNKSVGINSNALQDIHGGDDAQYLQILGGGAVDGEITIPFTCAAGDYTIVVCGAKISSMGITQLKVDGTNIGSTFDWYSAGWLNNTDWKQTGLTLTEGRHLLHVKVVSKHASGGYDAILSEVRFRREP